MRVGIDTSNLTGGGGVTHLAELLRHADPRECGFDRVVVWGVKKTLDHLDARPWLDLVAEPELEHGLRARVRWQRGRLDQLARASSDVLFVPGGAYTGSFSPVVTMFRNMLPFQFRERARFGLTRVFARLTLLHFVQSWTFHRSDGVIFLSDFALERVGRGLRSVAVIPHGVSDRFRMEPREQKPLASYSYERPFRFLYTSIIDMYKHQWQVARAVIDLRDRGLPVALDLVGPSYPPAMRRLERALREDRHGVVRIRGAIPHADLAQIHRQADAFVFASSCENLPNILLEAMAAGLPIACSDRRPMPDILQDGGAYFDPEDPSVIANTLLHVATEADLRQRIAARAFAIASEHSWERCARETFAFLRAQYSRIPT